MAYQHKQENEIQTFRRQKIALIQKLDKTLVVKTSDRDKQLVRHDKKKRKIYALKNEQIGTR
jgi:hypothetical protein